MSVIAGLLLWLAAMLLVAGIAAGVARRRARLGE